MIIRRPVPIFILVCIGLVAIFAVLLPAAGAENPLLSGKKICLDPGHGGSDPGAVYDDGAVYLEEKEINLDVSYALMSLLVEGGADVVLARWDDSSKDNGDRYTFCNSENADLLVSMHTNSVSYPDWDGSLVLYFHADDRELAQAIHDIMYPSLRASAPVEPPDVFVDYGLDRFASGVLLKSNMPAAMVEPLFMSYAPEAVLLQTRIHGTLPSHPEEVHEDLLQQLVLSGECGDVSSGYTCRRGEIATAVYNGILHYYAGAAPDPTPTPEPPPAETGVMHASVDISATAKKRQIFIDTTVTVDDENIDPVSGVTVFLTTTLPLGEVMDTAVTGADGTAAFRLRESQPGTYTSTVTDLAKDGWSYNDLSGAADSVFVP